MNFSPFGSPFPGSIPGIHQFAASGALSSSATSVQVRCLRKTGFTFDAPVKIKIDYRTQPTDIIAVMWICLISIRAMLLFSVNFVPTRSSIRIWTNTMDIPTNTLRRIHNNQRTPTNDPLQRIHNLPQQLQPQLKRRLNPQVISVFLVIWPFHKLNNMFHLISMNAPRNISGFMQCNIATTKWCQKR